MSAQKDKFALIIGVGDDLPYTVQDAKSIYKTITHPDRVGYLPENVCLKTGEEADRRGIFEGLQFLIERAGKEDTVLIYYSGHGGTYQFEENGKPQSKYFLQPYGMRADNYATHWVTAEELTEAVNRIQSNRIVFLMDCCHAEGMTQGGLAKMNEMAQKLNNEGGIWVISSSQDNEKSWRLPDADNSLFTECFLEVLTGRHRSPFTEPHITITDVVEHIFEEVPKRAAQVLDEKTGQAISQHPYAKFQMAENVILSHFEGQRQAIMQTVDNLLPQFSTLSVRAVIELVGSMRLLAQNEKAIQLLETHPELHNEQDLLNILGELYKDMFLTTHQERMGIKAQKTHQKALELAQKNNDKEQVYLNAINLAYIGMQLQDSEDTTLAYVSLAKDFAEKTRFSTPSKKATLCEVYLYENKLEKASELLTDLANCAGAAFKMQAYKEIRCTFEMLYGKNPHHPFQKLLEAKLLT